MPESFHLASAVPTVTLGVRDDKSRKGKTQPVPAGLAAILRAHQADKPRGQPVWPTNGQSTAPPP